MPDKYKSRTKTPAYTTYSLLEPDKRDPVTNAPEPSEAAIEFAKRTVDDNEK